MNQRVDSLIARQSFLQDMELIAMRYRGLLPQEWEDALNNLVNAVNEDVQ